MDNDKILENIEPFNDIFYKSCFYNALFPILVHFNKDILPILINDIPVYNYKFKAGNTNFTMSNLFIKPIDELLDSLGINVKISNYKEYLLDDIIASISQKKPVIVSIDPFFDSLRKDVYQKNHFEHALLIYGYDETQKVLNIIEHKDRNILSYEKRNISFDDMEKAYTYNRDLQAVRLLADYYEFQLKKTNVAKNEYQFNIDDYRKKFVHNFSLRKLEVREGLEKLNAFKEQFEKIVSDENCLCEMADGMIDSFNKIVYVKQAEIYKLSKLYEEGIVLLNLQEECLRYWILIRNHITKYNFTRIYKREKLYDLVEKLKIIYDIESSYYKEIMLMCNFQK